MASWKRHISVANIRTKTKNKEKGGGSGTSKNYSSYLPSVYAGISNRTDR